MASNFHYSIDLNKDQNQQHFLYHLESSLHHHHHDHHHQVPSSSSSSPTSSSYFPFLINSHQDQLHLGYNNTYHALLDHQPLQSKIFGSSDGTSSCDQMVPKKETRLKLKIRKRDNNHQDQTHLVQYPTQIDTTTTNSIKWLSSKMRLMKKKKKTIITNQEDHQDFINNGSNINDLIRVCSDCNTTKTPLWRSGPSGPKSLCNACGIRQRKARWAAMAAAATTLEPPLQPLHKKKKKSKVSSSSSMVSKAEKCIKMVSLEEEEAAATSSSSNKNKNKLCFEDLTIMLSKNSTYHQMFPQDEKEAAILLMALSYGMVH